jgi:uncharacterized protein YwqG
MRWLTLLGVSVLLGLLISVMRNALQRRSALGKPTLVAAPAGPPIESVEELVSSAHEIGFTRAESLRELARTGLALVPDGQTVNDPLASRFGGLPALPATIPWPQRNGRSLSFVAQMNLAALPHAPLRLGLPAQGLLLFFYDAEQATWGFEPGDAGSFAVIHVIEPDATAPLRELPADLPEHARFSACTVSATPALTLSPWDSVQIDALGFEGPQRDAYFSLHERVSPDDAGSRGLLGGHPDQIQGDMALECAMVSAGRSCGDGTAYQDPRLSEWRAQARDWRLLLQVPSVDEAGMMWGDAGCLYFWIHEQDLEDCRFERCWMILQCF